MLTLPDTDLNIKDKEWLTPANHTARYRYFDALKALYVTGCRLTETDNQGRTAMQHSVRLLTGGAFQSLFSAYLESSSENGVNVLDADNWTPIHWARKGCDPDVLRLLVSGSDGRVKACRRRWYPMHIAKFHEKWLLDEILFLLLALIPRLKTPPHRRPALRCQKAL